MKHFFQAIRNNIAYSEFITNPDRTLCGQKVEDIIRTHVKNRQQERKEDPGKYITIYGKL